MEDETSSLLKLTRMEHCPKTAMEEFESKINFAARIAQPQARLNLV
jgi:hypothetical protein